MKHMQKNLIYAAIAIVVVAAVVYGVWGRTWLSDRTESVVVYETASNEAVSLAFSYPSGEAGYSLIEPPVEGELIDAWIMMGTPDYIKYQQADATDAPASMNVFVFKLPDEVEEAESVERAGRITRLQNWANEKKNITYIDRAYGTPEIVEIDGVKALKYDTTGLFEQSIYLASYQSNVYMFVGQYDRPTDNIKKDFEDLMASVRFE